MWVGICLSNRLAMFHDPFCRDRPCPSRIVGRMARGRLWRQLAAPGKLILPDFVRHASRKGVIAFSINFGNRGMGVP
jgi:hypothetical protein